MKRDTLKTKEPSSPIWYGLSVEPFEGEKVIVKYKDIEGRILEIPSIYCEGSFEVPENTVSEILGWKAR